MSSQSKGIKVYLDDLRDAPDNWIRTYWPEEAIELLKTGNVTEISLDHDLGNDPRNGYDVILWIEEAVAISDFLPPIIHVHSANLSAKVKMMAGIEKIYEMSLSKLAQKKAELSQILNQIPIHNKKI